MLLLPLLMLSGPALAQDVGELEVTVANGATGRIYIDGRDTSTDTPGVVKGVEAGNHMVQVKGDCLGAFTQIDVANGRRTTIELTLEAMGGFAEIVVEPKDATVSIDGDAMSPPYAVELACGDHEISAAKRGFVTETRTERVEMGGAYRYKFELLQEGFGSVSVDVTPDKAKVYIDGEQVAVGDATINQVKSGPHQVKAEANGYETAESSVAVRPNETTSVTLALTEIVTDKPPDITDPPPPPPVERDNKRLAGIGLAVVGAGALGYGGWQYGQARNLYNGQYKQLLDEDENKAEEFFYNEVNPRQVRGITAMVLGGVALAGGGALILVDDDGFYVGISRQF
ncbi:MAG: PEGA domain-containing protein [Alphaproteobacteria bacterium]|nr:PEGA domain-containing protein [Alphaproteobacteria bacterium]